MTGRASVSATEKVTGNAVHGERARCATIVTCAWSVRFKLVNRDRRRGKKQLQEWERVYAAGLLVGGDGTETGICKQGESGGRGGEEGIGKRRVVGLVKWRLVGGAGMSGRLPVRGREGCWGGSSEIEFTPSEVRQFVSDHGARKMLPVVYGTGGPPSSRWRRCATIFLGSASGSTSNIVNSCWIIKPTSTATVMTTALGLLMVLLPAAYPEKISIGEWVSNNRSNSVLSFVDRIREMAVKATKGERTRCKESFCDQRSNDYGGLLHSTPTCTFLFNDGWK